MSAYRADFQAICDSLVGDSRDSCMVMHHDPIVWNQGRQIFGEVIKVYSNDSTIRAAHVIGQAMSIEKCDEEEHYNQISANVIDADFIEGTLRKIQAQGNVKIIFYPIDEKDSSLMLLNYTETDTMRMYMDENRQLEKIWTNKHVSDMYPMSQIPRDKYQLPNFAWFEELRPKDKNDVFNWRGKSADSKLKGIKREPAPRQRLGNNNQQVEPENKLTNDE